MKKIYLMTAVLTLTVFTSCKKNEKEEVVITPTEIEAPLETVQKECFQAIIEKDTITLSVDINSVNEFKGDLDYTYYEKDRNFGSLLGNVKGDTIFADYTFESEGKTSVREMAFLKKDANTYLEGYGDKVETNGKIVFKDKTKLRYDGNVVYNKIPCKE